MYEDYSWNHPDVTPFLREVISSANDEMSRYPKYRGASDSEITVQIPQLDGALPDLFSAKPPKDEF